jgi:hypothetical protein
VSKEVEEQEEERNRSHRIDDREGGRARVAERRAGRADPSFVAPLVVHLFCPSRSREHFSANASRNAAAILGNSRTCFQLTRTC